MGRSVDQSATGRAKRVRSKINWSKLTSQRLSLSCETHLLPSAVDLRTPEKIVSDPTS